jgi:hypothetical protein
MSHDDNPLNSFAFWPIHPIVMQRHLPDIAGIRAEKRICQPPPAIPPSANRISAGVAGSAP